MSADPDTITVRGMVVDPDGRPVAGAIVTVPSTPTWDQRTSRWHVAHTTTGADGRFVISFSRSAVSPFSLGGGTPGSEAWKHATIVAFATGYGIAWRRRDAADAAGDVVLKLAPDDIPIEMRVLDLEGRPIAAAQVTVASVAADDALLELPMHSIGKHEPMATGRNGQLSITGLGRDRNVNLRLVGRTVGYASIDVATREMEPQTRVIEQPIGTAPKFVTYGARFDYHAVPGISVSGVVRDADTGKPLAGVTVQSLRFAGPFQGFDPQGLLTCVTDEHGRYRLEGFPKGEANSFGEGNAIIAVPNEDQPYFMRQAKLPETSDLTPPTIDFDLHRGVWITGTVTDAATGEPLPARLMYSTYLDNPHAAKLPEFHRFGGGGMIDGYQGHYETKSDGTYRLVAVPGKALLAVWCMIERYRNGVGSEGLELFARKAWMGEIYQPFIPPRLSNAIAEINVPENVESVRCDFQLERGETIRVQVIDPDRVPTRAKLLVRGNTAENYGGWHCSEMIGPEFDAIALSPSEQRTLIIVDESRKLGAITQLSLEQTPRGQVAVQLHPLAEVRGRVVDDDGKPLPDLSLEPRIAARALPEITTAADGSFHCLLPTGGDYYIMVDRGRYTGAIVAKGLQPRPAETLDLGDVAIHPRMR